LPSKPLFGPHSVGELNYNKVEFDPIWAALQDHDLAATFHVSTGKDPRSAWGLGGAVINYVVHSLAPTIEPLVHICSSGVAERFPKLRFGTIETGIGWLAWMLDAMDEAYLKHHFWIRPQLKALPSDYFRANGFASFGEDKPGLDLIEKHNLVDNVLWANDYPHHEGTGPEALFGMTAFDQYLFAQQCRARPDGGCIARDPFHGPVGEATVRRGHMLRDRCVATIARSAHVRSDPLPFVEQLDGRSSNPCLYGLPREAIWHRVIMPLDLDMVIEPCAPAPPFGINIRLCRQRLQRRAVDLLEQLAPRLPDPAQHAPIVELHQEFGDRRVDSARLKKVRRRRRPNNQRSTIRTAASTFALSRGRRGRVGSTVLS